MIASTGILVLCAALAAGDDAGEFAQEYEQFGDNVNYVLDDQVMLTQATAPATSPSSNLSLSTQQRRASAGSSYARLARTPNMFGDSLPPPFVAFLCACNPEPTSQVVTQVFSGGGTRYTPISENNKPIPMDRVFFNFNGFTNAVTTVDLFAGNTFDSNFYRYSFGFEKTFFDQQASIELRLPLTSSIDINRPDISSSSGNIGNLMLVYKQLLYRDEATAVAVGVGAGLPTGADFQGLSGPTPFRLSNDSVYLLPYIGLTRTVGERLFVTSYLQVDIATGGDEFITGQTSLGRINAPTYGRWDAGGGYWLTRDMPHRYLWGIAAIAEFHYLTTFSDADAIIADTQRNSFALAGSDNRVDFLNCTVGAHFQITDLSNLRVSGVFPMRNAPDRQFDSEVQVSFNRYF